MAVPRASLMRPCSGEGAPAQEAHGGMGVTMHHACDAHPAAPCAAALPSIRGASELGGNDGDVQTLLRVRQQQYPHTSTLYGLSLRLPGPACYARGCKPCKCRSTGISIGGSAVRLQCRPGRPAIQACGLLRAAWTFGLTRWRLGPGSCRPHGRGVRATEVRFALLPVQRALYFHLPVHLLCLPWRVPVQAETLDSSAMVRSVSGTHRTLV